MAGPLRRFFSNLLGFPERIDLMVVCGYSHEMMVGG